jgi:phosphosulfolactate synthase (CoM biosynthesis protein A)
MQISFSATATENYLKHIKMIGKQTLGIIQGTIDLQYFYMP